MRSYHSALALSVLLSAMACTQDRSPTGPEAAAAPELSATAAATLVFRATLFVIDWQRTLRSGCMV